MTFDLDFVKYQIKEHFKLMYVGYSYRQVDQFKTEIIPTRTVVKTRPVFFGLFEKKEQEVVECIAVYLNKTFEFRYVDVRKKLFICYGVDEMNKVIYWKYVREESY